MIRNLIEARWDEWTRTLPLPERGEPGPQGERGFQGEPGMAANADRTALPAWTARMPTLSGRGAGSGQSRGIASA